MQHQIAQGSSYAEDREWGPLTGAVLIGGKSSRMGPRHAPKHEAALPDGRAMIEHVAAALAQVCPRIVLVGAHHSDHARGYSAIADQRPHRGPLAGIEALLVSGSDRGGEYLVCPCDVPLMSADVLRLIARPSMAAATVARLENRADPEWLPARISARVLPMVRALLDSSERGGTSWGPPVWRLMQALPAEVIIVPAQHERCFHNVNTPADLHPLDG